MWISQNEDTQKYSIDTDGNVYSNITNRFLKPLNRSNGYHFVNIQGKCISVHRLVALNYLDKPLEGQNQVNHIDGNKKNNCVSNLEWVTQSENLHYSQNQQRLYKGQSKGGITTSTLMRNKALKDADKLVNTIHGIWKVIQNLGFLPVGKQGIKRIFFLCECCNCGNKYKVDKDYFLKYKPKKCNICQIQG